MEGPRIVYLVETRLEKDSSGMELLRSLFSSQNGDYITAVDEKNIILIKAVERDASPESLELVANTIVDMMNSEAMLKVRVSYGTVVQELREVSKSYKEATMAMDVEMCIRDRRKRSQSSSILPCAASKNARPSAAIYPAAKLQKNRKSCSQDWM